jgi:hypothetical protein
MRLTVLLLVLALLAYPCDSAETKRKTKPKSFWNRLFMPREENLNRKSRRYRAAPRKKTAVHPHPAPKPSPTPRQPPRDSKGFYIVDAQWYANYLAEVATWDYWIPEEASIRADKGKIHVPPIVYKHYEDMVKTPHPKPSPPISL